MEPQPVQLSFPKPGRALGAMLATLAGLGVVTAFLATWVPGGVEVFRALACDLGRAWPQVWRLLSSGLLTSPAHWQHLVFSLLGLYFLGASLEQRWGGWRLVRFVALAIVFGNLLTAAVDAIAPESARQRFHQGDVVFGPAAALAAIGIAWSREFADQRVMLFFFVPVRGRWLFWATIVFCVLDLIFLEAPPEGRIAPFGGVVAGLLLGGSPSLARQAWLHLRLAMLRRRAGHMRVEDVLSARTTARRRASGPPLRVLSGGLEDALKKHEPPKDKRQLN